MQDIFFVILSPFLSILVTSLSIGIVKVMHFLRLSDNHSLIHYEKL